MYNYFNTLNLREQLAQLGVCRFMDKAEFTNKTNHLKGKKVVIIGCGMQGLNQGLNMRDSGLDVCYALRQTAIDEQRQSYKNTQKNGFNADNYANLIPQADLVINLTPDKQHTSVVSTIMPLMKKGAALGYSHGFNIVEEGMEIRKDITVVMVAPKCPGTEVRAEYKRGFGVPTLMAVHPENDPQGEGHKIAKAWVVATGGHRAGVLESSFVAEVKSDLMGEQTVLCGMLQASSIVCYEKMVANGIEPDYAGKLLQFGWKTITEALKYGGITHMMDRLSNLAKITAFKLSEDLKDLMRPLYNKHMDNIISGHFSSIMMADWVNNDVELLGWREEMAGTAFEQYPESDVKITEQEYFDNGILMVAMIRASIELAFETMTASGIIAESVYYEALHELPFLANTISRKRLYEMNRVISDTAEYGSYVFTNVAKVLLREKFMPDIDTDVIGKGLGNAGNDADNATLIAVNKTLRSHPLELIGHKLRNYMAGMKPIIGNE
ncbi:ketol-acid reductoisomerase [Candidatus Enterovibrio altilux]|uniref:Ketol-acid reductoisomerase n=1 Tax=Candidatus Enterovibrio altilux TaxID=1927128 RepID=A0A291B8W9_9GAMM|nr:ketol-acid reductoisomerase [Candidatus Enterovibrio luxaltus]ATF09444.1 Ketol-acid reductoisomerase [Candidatus Enterovibrio luxaltus]